MQKPLIESCALAILRLTKESCGHVTAKHGKGVFYAAFRDEAECSAFLDKPTLAEGRVMFMDAERAGALRMPDIALGAMMSGRAEAVVVVDVFSPGMRCVTDSDETPHTAKCQLRSLAVPVTKEAPSVLGEGICEAAERAVREQVRGAPLTRGGCVFFVEQQAPSGRLHVDLISPEEVQSAMSDMQAIAPAGGSLPGSATTLSALARECATADNAVIWLRSAAEETADTAWIVHFARVGSSP